jgi:hypothetical protein
MALHTDATGVNPAPPPAPSSIHLQDPASIWHALSWRPDAHAYVVYTPLLWRGFNLLLDRGLF